MRWTGQRARFFRELNEAYPEAKFVLGYRDPDSWAESFDSTIHQLVSAPEKAPPHFREWLDMSTEVVRQTGIPIGAGQAKLARAFSDHVAAVKLAIPAERLLVHQAKDGWEPLCTFLKVAVPDEPFPRTNNRSEFWDLINGVR